MILISAFKQPTTRYFSAKGRPPVLALLLAALLCCSACFSDKSDGGGGSSDNSSDNPISSTPTTDSNTVTDGNGRAAMSFEIEAGVNKFSITAESPAALMQINSLTNASGTDWVTVNGVQVSDAASFAPVPSTANAPARAQDPVVGAGTFRVVATAANRFSSPSVGTSVIFTLNTRSDGDLNSGSLAINIFYVGDVAQINEVKNATRTAIQGFRSIYQSQANISLVINEFDIDGPVLLPLPFSGDPLFLTASSTGPSPAVNIVIGGDLAQFDGSVYGIAAAVPGPPIPTRKSAVAISAVAAAGPDGAFSDSDIRIYGETLAHECGHYMGLYHPVELDSAQVFGNDPLGDTPTCGAVQECLENQALISNLMFPSPVGDTLQNQLTDAQAGVLNRYVIVD